MKILNSNKKSVRTSGFSFLFIVTALIAGCKKFVDVPAPVNQIENTTLYASDKASVSAALGVYATMSQLSLNICAGGTTIFPGLSADELIYTSFNNDYKQFQNNSIQPSNQTGIYSSLWRSAYTNIYNCNAVLQGVTASTKISDSTRNQLTGEMLVVRSLNYFCLVNEFGNVPLELTTNYQLNAKMPRTLVNQVYAQLVTDLLKAETLLPVAYPSALKARPNKWTAAALLAKVYLYQKDWQNALLQSSAVINANSYNLEPDLNNVFLNTSNEVIWQLANDYQNNQEGTTFIPYSTSAVPRFILNDYLLNSFEAGDLRKTDWLGYNTINGTNYYYPYKYKNNSSSPITEYEVIFRLAEIYLIRAEANARLNNLSASIADVNLIRNRAGLLAVSGPDQTQILSLIAHERQIELFCEWGNRFFDLKRTGQADQVLGIEKAPYWKSQSALYPLPISELRLNPALEQNPGY